jgi:hypothetical protein
MDGAILSHAHTNWLSDQPQAVAKLAVHFDMHLPCPLLSVCSFSLRWRSPAINRGRDAHY